MDRRKCSLLVVGPELPDPNLGGRNRLMAEIRFRYARVGACLARTATGWMSRSGRPVHALANHVVAEALSSRSGVLEYDGPLSAMTERLDLRSDSPIRGSCRPTIAPRRRLCPLRGVALKDSRDPVGLADCLFGGLCGYHASGDRQEPDWRTCVDRDQSLSACGLRGSEVRWNPAGGVDTHFECCIHPPSMDLRIGDFWLDCRALSGA